MRTWKGPGGNFANDQLAVVLSTDTSAQSRNHTVLLPPGTANHSELTRSAADLKKLVEEEYLKPVEDLVHEGMTPREKIAAIRGTIDRINRLTQETVNSFNAASKVVHPVQERSGFQRSSRMNLGGSGGHPGQGGKASISGREHSGKPYEIRATMERDDDTAVNPRPNYNQTHKRKTYGAGSGRKK